MFQKATKYEAKVRLALVGPSGSGKTYTALRIATEMRSLSGEKAGRIAMVDSEHGSASKYADLFDFDVVELDSYDPRQLITLIHEADKAGYFCLIIDSLSHFWSGRGGELEMVDRAAARSRSKNSFMAWKEVTPVHNELVDTIIASKLHQITTLRVKTEWVMEKNDRTGKTEPHKVGLQPVMRDGIEYEFDVVADLDNENNFIVSKSRCPDLTEFVGKKVGPDVAGTIWTWLQGAPAPPVVSPPPVQPASPPATADAPRNSRSQPRREPAPADPVQDDVPMELQALWGQMKNFATTVAIIQGIKKDIEEMSGSDRPYYDILGRYGMNHANDLRGHKRSEVKKLVRELYEYHGKCQAALSEPPAAGPDIGDGGTPLEMAGNGPTPDKPYQGTDDDIPDTLGGTWTPPPPEESTQGDLELLRQKQQKEAKS